MTWMECMCGVSSFGSGQITTVECISLKAPVIQAVKAFEVDEFAKKVVKTNLFTHVKYNKVPPNDISLMNQNSPWGGLEVEVFNPTNYSMNILTEEEMDTTLFNTCYSNDTMTPLCYSNDTMTPLDFLGGFMTSYPTPQPNYAIENLSIDDLDKI